MLRFVRSMSAGLEWRDFRFHASGRLPVAGFAASTIGSRTCASPGGCRANHTACKKQEVDSGHFRRPRESRSGGQSGTSAIEMIQPGIATLSQTHKKAPPALVCATASQETRRTVTRLGSAAPIRPGQASRAPERRRSLGHGTQQSGRSAVHGHWPIAGGSGLGTDPRCAGCVVGPMMSVWQVYAACGSKPGRTYCTSGADASQPACYALFCRRLVLAQGRSAAANVRVSVTGDGFAQR